MALLGFFQTFIKMLQNCCVTTRLQYVIIINFVYTVFHLKLMILKCLQHIKTQKWCNIQKVLQLRRATVYLKGYVFFCIYTNVPEQAFH